MFSISRLVVVPVILSASILGFSHSASATTAASSCKANAGVNSIVYKVNGNVVPDLRGHVAQGANVSIDFKIVAGCSNVPVNISAYQAPSATWDPKVADKQVLVSSAAGTFNADSKVHTLNITAPNCYYQVDFGTGTPMAHISGTSNQGSTGDLISADNGGTKACVTTTSTTVPKTTTTLPATTTTVPKTTTTLPKATTTTVPQTTTTVPQTTTTVVNVTTTIPNATTTTVANNTTTTVPTQVLAVTVDNTTTTLPAQVEGEALAFTGSNSAQLAFYGTILVLLGVAISGFAKSIKRRRI